MKKKKSLLQNITIRTNIQPQKQRSIQQTILNLPILHKELKMEKILHNVKIVQGNTQPEPLEKQMLTNTKGTSNSKQCRCEKNVFYESVEHVQIIWKVYHCKQGHHFTINSDLSCVFDDLLYVLRYVEYRNEYIYNRCLMVI